jgi:hypothetical protein
VVILLPIIIRARLFLLFYFDIRGTSGAPSMRRLLGNIVNGRCVHKRRVITTSIINNSNILLGEWVIKVEQLMIGISVAAF